MGKIILKPINEAYMHDFIALNSKRKWVEFNVKIDGCGNVFKISKEELLKVLKWKEYL